MLNISADDLLQLPGVGPKRRSQLVEMVVDLATDGIVDDSTENVTPEPAPERTAGSTAITPRPIPEPSAPTQAQPCQTSSSPVDPTSEELLAAANAPRYTPAPVQSSWNAPAPMDPAPSQVKRPKASKVFKRSAGLGVLCFFLFGLCIETFALGFLLAGLTAAISGVMALINLVRGK